MHCIFTYTLQTKHMECPCLVTQLVEPTGTHTCSEYFFLHLIQDITDLTTITNKTFEEAVLIIHTLIEQLMDERMSIITLNIIPRYLLYISLTVRNPIYMHLLNLYVLIFRRYGSCLFGNGGRP